MSRNAEKSKIIKKPKKKLTKPKIKKGVKKKLTKLKTKKKPTLIGGFSFAGLAL